MEVKKRRGRKRVLSPKEKFLEYSGTFGAFGRLFQTSSEQAKVKAEKDAVMAKVCSGLSEVCKMLATETKEE